MATKQLIAGKPTKIYTAFLKAIKSTGTQLIQLGDYNYIGRDSINDIHLTDPFVSRRHAKIELQDEFYYLRDLRSQNGCYINGTRIFEAQLSPGDKIKIGEMEFLFVKQHELSPRVHLQSKNSTLQHMIETIPGIAQTELSILLTGESGTGKEVFARAIHESSKRCKGPFVSINCSALQDNLFESELFGHRKGSFTDASSDRKGAFEQARGGTLFLDEIGDLPLHLQPKLLRAIENQEIRPIGSDSNVKTDVRIISATHKKLSEQVFMGEFRQDLYYRLNVIRLSLPALRDRPEDIENLLIYFAREMGVKFNMDAIRELKQYIWPGNIRELKNMVARASAVSTDSGIGCEDLRLILDRPEEPTQNIVRNRSVGKMIKEFEYNIIEKTLHECFGNQRKAAAKLGIPKSTLNDKIKSYGIDARAIKKSFSTSR